jgi:hypothetical protein
MVGKSITLEQRPIKKRYFSASEVARMMNETPNCIHWWATKFKIKKHQGRVRIFSRVAVARIHLIRRMIRDEKLSGWEVHDKLALMIQMKQA